MGQSSNMKGWRARTDQCAEVIPHFRNERVEPNGARVRVQRISVLIDLIVQDTDGAPEGRVTTLAVDRLLVGLVCFGILLLGHVASAQEVPALSIVLIGRDRLLQELDGALLALEATALLVVKPAKLLQNLGVTRITFQDALVSGLCAVVLFGSLSQLDHTTMAVLRTYVLLLLMNMSNLEEDVFLTQGRRRRRDDILEAL